MGYFVGVCLSVYVFDDYIHTLLPVVIKSRIMDLVQYRRTYMLGLFILFPFQNGGWFWIFFGVTVKRLDRLSWISESTYLIQRWNDVRVRLLINFHPVSKLRTIFADTFCRTPWPILMKFWFLRYPYKTLKLFKLLFNLTEIVKIKSNL